MWCYPATGTPSPGCSAVQTCWPPPRRLACTSGRWCVLPLAIVRASSCCMYSQCLRRLLAPGQCWACCALGHGAAPNSAPPPCPIGRARRQHPRSACGVLRAHRRLLRECCAQPLLRCCGARRRLGQPLRPAVLPAALARGAARAAARGGGGSAGAAAGHPGDGGVQVCVWCVCARVCVWWWWWGLAK